MLPQKKNINNKRVTPSALLLRFTFFIFYFLFAVKAQSQYYQYVDPFIGSQGEGNVFVGPSCPFGMVKPGPDCNKNANSGYSPDMNKTLYGFSQTHVSGTGGGPKYGNVSVMPFAGDFESIKQESLRENEKVSAGYYSVLLKKWNIKTEITASRKVAYYKFSFANKNKKAVKIDCGEFLGESIVPDGREAQQFVGSEMLFAFPANDATIAAVNAANATPFKPAGNKFINVG